GVVITVSHDRYFLDKVVDELIVFEGEGKVSHFYGNYSEYADQLKTKKQSAKPAKQVEQTAPKKKEKTRLSYHEKKEWETIEDEIETEEERKKKKKPKKKIKKTKKKKKKKTRLSYQEKKEWETIEDEIETVEERIESLQTQIAAEGSNIEAVQDLYTEQQALEEKLEEKMERWETLSLLVESFEAK